MVLRKDYIDIIEDTPFPDVWAPLTDSLQLLAGTAPFDVSGGVTLPLKSMSFIRATTATYIDKSGALKTAAINEPRFEKEGLLIEGQGANLILNSSDPAKWQTTASLTKTVLASDGDTQSPSAKLVINAAAVFHTIIASTSTDLIENESLTLSCRAKGNYGNIRLAFTLNGNTTVAIATFDSITGAVTSSSATVKTTSVKGNDGYTYMTATHTVATAGTYAGSILTQKNAADTESPVNSEFYLQTPQCEKNPVATSYIPTGASTVTRAGESCMLQAANNCGYRLTGDLFERTVAFEMDVKAFAPPPLGYHSAVATAGAGQDIIMRMVSDSLNSLRANFATIPVLSVTYPLARQMFVQTIDKTNKLTAYFGGKSGTRTGTPALPAAVPAQITFASNPFVVYHVRNFRIWHLVLKFSQIKGLR